ncbi:MAG TPA: hypothetical protein VHS06_03065 [Chloroflexota bacterium]|nr:hypothetical protein [Chloroflexota bacterium]
MKKIGVDLRRLAVPIALVALFSGLALYHVTSALAAAAASPVCVNISASVTPDPVEKLDRVTVASRFSALGAVAEPLQARLDVLSVEGGNSVLTMKQSGFRLPEMGSRAIYWEWRVPDSVPEGQYALRLTVVGADSGRLYGEVDNAATLAVVRR